MSCFTTLDREIAVAPGCAPGGVFELKMLPLDQIKASAGPPAPKPTATDSGAPAAQTPTVATSTAQPAAAPSITAANDAANAAAAKNKKKAPAKGKTATPAAPGSFQRTDLNASSDASAASSAAPATPGVGELSSAGTADALSVGGSTSNGIESRAIGNARKGPGSLYNLQAFSNLDSSRPWMRVQFSQYRSKQSTRRPMSTPADSRFRRRSAADSAPLAHQQRPIPPAIQLETLQQRQQFACPHADAGAARGKFRGKVSSAGTAAWSVFDPNTR